MSFPVQSLAIVAALSLVSASALAAVKAPEPAVKPDAGQVAFFEKNIRPVFAAKCYKCFSNETHFSVQ